MEKPVNLNSENVYEIVVSGSIDLFRLMEFGGVDVRPEVDGSRRHRTLFRIVTDQTGMVGLIRRMHGLGIVLLSISQV